MCACVCVCVCVCVWCVCVVAGRTATRCNIGRPQVRWEDGHKVAKNLLESRELRLEGNNALCIASRIRNVLNELRLEAVQPHDA